jgi:hypothetical protein
VLRPEPGADPTHVIVLRTLGAPERRWLRGRRASPAEPSPEPTPVATAGVTVIETAQPLSADEAAAWLKGLGAEGQDEELADGIDVVNRMLHAQRVAAAEPYLREVSREGALVARVGYGSGDEVADGRWSEALEVPPGRRRQRRVAALRPQERLAALLGARDRALICEDLVLRARADLDGGRPRQAALQLRVALEAGIAELEAAGRATDMADRVAELREGRDVVAAAANAAVRGELDDGATGDVEHVLGRLEAALRARSAASGFD